MPGQPRAPAGGRDGRAGHNRRSESSGITCLTGHSVPHNCRYTSGEVALSPESLKQLPNGWPLTVAYFHEHQLLGAFE